MTVASDSQRRLLPCGVSPLRLSPVFSLRSFPGCLSLLPPCAQWWGFYLELPEQLKFVEAFSVKVKERLAAPRGLNQVRGGNAMTGKLGSADYHPLCHCKVAKQCLHTFGVPLHTVLIGSDVSGGNWNGMSTCKCKRAPRTRCTRLRRLRMWFLMLRLWLCKNPTLP